MGLLFFTVLGLKTCLENILSEKGKRIFISGTAAVYVIFAVSFIHYYFTQYTQETHPLYLFCDTYEEDVYKRQVQNITAEELEKRAGQGYNRNSIIGKAGAERIYEEQLRPKDGYTIQILNQLGEVKDTVLELSLIHI